MTKLGDKVVCLKLDKYVGSLTIDKHYTIEEILHKVPFDRRKSYGGFYRQKQASDTEMIFIIKNDLGLLIKCDFCLFETYDEWLAKWREQQMKTVLDD